MSYLLVDNSNTRTKFALCEEHGQVDMRVIPTVEISSSALQLLLQDWQFEKVCLCSVVPGASAVIRQVCKGKEIIVLDARTSDAVNFSQYPGIDTLGADRVANVLAAVRLLDLPVVAVDAGTATTFDVVTMGADGPCFRGGVIAPGIAAMARCLNLSTALLPVVEGWQSAPTIGRDTAESMGSAIRLGYPAMVDAILDSIEQEVGQPVHVVLTGGDAGALAPLLRRSCHMAPLLTLQGLAFVAGIQI